ncbi:MAG TPA: hydrogenase maturation protease [Burkholderiaceae bacterium]|nr:hydrogenase maturation protease [Burkholderiaceae bacterium]
MLTVIGCGNSNRCDDGAGVVVAQALLARLREHPRGDVRVFDAGTAGIDVMFQARGARHLIIVDAARTGAEPGTIIRVPGAELVAERQPTLTLHDFRWDHALMAGRMIFREDFPTDVTVYLIEAGNVGFGLELSPAVQDAARRVAAELGSVIDAYAG